MTIVTTIEQGRVKLRRKRSQPRTFAPLRETYKVPDRRWALAIAMAMHHGDISFAIIVAAIHPKVNFMRLLAR